VSYQQESFLLKNIISCHNAYTLLELLIIILIFFVLASTATANLQSTLTKVKLSHSKTKIISLLNFARNLALLTHTDTIACPSVDKENCTTKLTWKYYWIVFSDKNKNKKRDDDEKVLKINYPTNGIKILSTAKISKLIFSNKGAHFSNLTIKLCDPLNLMPGIKIILATTGRIRTEKASISHCQS